MILSASARWSALQELRSLGAYARRTGQDLVAMIEVPPHVREDLEEFCRNFPDDARPIREALAVRDYMLDRVERNEVLRP